jgi:single-strand DNA-binding protein
MNNVSLIGRLTQDTSLKYLPTGTAVLKNTLAVNRRKKDETDFINITAFGKGAELIANHLTKGDQVGLTGHIQTGSYEKDGRKVYTFEVVVDGVIFIGSKKQGKPKQADPFQDNGIDISDEGLPF